jgi:type I site-specific restriction endonuclease
LREFQDNEKTIPIVLTTSQKLSTGVDARNIRNIVLMRPVNQIIEFKQIVGRGTRLFEGKEFFTIYDFVDAYQRFSDPEWDGEPVEEDTCKMCEKEPSKPCPECGELLCICIKEPLPVCDKCGQSPCVCSKKVKIKLKDGKEREIPLQQAHHPIRGQKTVDRRQVHAAAVRDLVNQYKGFKDANYCVRVTANDGEIGEQFLREFQDNEKTIPTVLTTSQKLSTGVDARNIRNIVLMRPVNQITLS